MTFSSLLLQGCESFFNHTALTAASSQLSLNLCFWLVKTCSLLWWRKCCHFLFDLYSVSCQEEWKSTGVSALRLRLLVVLCSSDSLICKQETRGGCGTSHAPFWSFARAWTCSLTQDDQVADTPPSHCANRYSASQWDETLISNDLSALKNSCCKLSLYLGLTPAFSIFLNINLWL